MCNDRPVIILLKQDWPLKMHSLVIWKHNGDGGKAEDKRKIMQKK